MWAFKNWFDGEVVAGPNVDRYWIELLAKWPYKKMPDPKGAERLLNIGVDMKYVLTVEERVRDVESEKDLDDKGKPKIDKYQIWLIHFKFPRRLLEDELDIPTDIYDDDIDTEDVEDAKDAKDKGIDQEDIIKQDDQEQKEVEPEEEQL